MNSLSLTKFMTALHALGAVALGQISATDPDLRLWLKAETLSADEVSEWRDSSPHKTRFAVPAIGEAKEDIVNHTPQLVEATTEAGTFKAVLFRNAFDPATPHAVNGHVSDRLWQVSNLGPKDPTAIDQETPFHLFVVYRNTVLNAALGPDQCVVAKRGPSEAPYQLGFGSAARQDRFIVYGGTVVYHSGIDLPDEPAWGVVGIQVTSGEDPSLSFSAFHEGAAAWKRTTMPVGRGPSGATEVNAAFWSAESTPFTLGFHTQSISATAKNPFGNGLYERFAGEIAEVVLISRALNDSDRTGMENYLVNKYIKRLAMPAPPPVAIDSIDLQGSPGVRVSWPQANAAGWSLDASTDLRSWTPSSAPVVREGRFLVEDKRVSQRYYRLRR